MSGAVEPGRRRGPTQRELNRRATRRALATAALELFASNGYEATTVDDIAARAGVSPRTFFLHFPTKAAAAYPDHDVRLRRFVHLLGDPESTPDPVARVILVLRTTLDASSSTRRLRYQLMMGVDELRDEDARSDRDYEAAIAEFLLRGWGEWPASVEARLRARATANAMIGVVRAALLAWGEDDVDPGPAAGDVLDRLFGVGISRPMEIRRARPVADGAAGRGDPPAADVR